MTNNPKDPKFKKGINQNADHSILGAGMQSSYGSGNFQNQGDNNLFVTNITSGREKLRFFNSLAESLYPVATSYWKPEGYESFWDSLNSTEDKDKSDKIYEALAILYNQDPVAKNLIEEIYVFQRRKKSIIQPVRRLFWVTRNHLENLPFCLCI